MYAHKKEEENKIERKQGWCLNIMCGTLFLPSDSKRGKFTQKEPTFPSLVPLNGWLLNIGHNFMKQKSFEAKSFF